MPSSIKQGNTHDLQTTNQFSMSDKWYAICTHIREDSEVSLDFRKNKGLPKDRCSERTYQRVKCRGVCQANAEAGNISTETQFYII